MLGKLSAVMPGNLQPLDIEAFIELYMRLKLDYKFLSNCGKYLGMTVFNDTDRVIFYDPCRDCADYMHASAGTVIIDSTLLTPKSEHRMRFTLGHEGAGHAFLHEDYYSRHSQSNALYASPEGMLLKSRDQYHERRTGKWAKRTDEDWMEWQADAIQPTKTYAGMRRLPITEDVADGGREGKARNRARRPSP